MDPEKPNPHAFAALAPGQTPAWLRRLRPPVKSLAVGTATGRDAPAGPHVFRPEDGDTLHEPFSPGSQNPTALRRGVGTLAADQEAHAVTRLALTSALARCEHLEAEILAVQEGEREHLGRELHDGVCQILAGVSLRLQCYARQVSGGQGSTGEHADEARHIDLLLREAFTEVRELSHRLVPLEPIAGPGGFGTALHRLAERTAARLGVQCAVRGCRPSLALEAVVSAHLLRVIQEAAANAKRHGGAGRIVIRLSRRGERGRLEIQDDGTGIPERVSAHAGLGLRTMAYRAAMAGGRLRVRRGGIAGGPGPGTTVNCSFAWRSSPGRMPSAQ